MHFTCGFQWYQGTLLGVLRGSLCWYTGTSIWHWQQRTYRRADTQLHIISGYYIVVCYLPRSLLRQNMSSKCILYILVPCWSITCEHYASTSQYGSAVKNPSVFSIVLLPEPDSSNHLKLDMKGIQPAFSRTTESERIRIHDKLMIHVHVRWHTILWRVSEHD